MTISHIFLLFCRQMVKSSWVKTQGPSIYICIFVCLYMYEYMNRLIDIFTYIHKMISKYLLCTYSFYFIMWWYVCLHMYVCIHPYMDVYESNCINFSDDTRKLRGKQNQDRDLGRLSHNSTIQFITPIRQRSHRWEMKVFGKCWTQQIHMENLAVIQVSSL